MVTLLENWSCFEAQEVVCVLWMQDVSAAYMHGQIVEVYGLWCAGSWLQSGAAHLHLAGTIWHVKIEVYYEDPRQHKSMLHMSRNSFRQADACNFAAYGIWPWGILLHCAACHSGCVTAPWVYARWVPHAVTATKQPEWWPVSVSSNRMQ
jgi:hypothetical protein